MPRAGTSRSPANATRRGCRCARCTTRRTGGSKGRASVRVTAQGCVRISDMMMTERLPATLQEPQRNAILSLLSERTLRWLEEMQMNPDKIPMSPAALRFKARLQAEGRREGRLEGLIEGERKG